MRSIARVGAAAGGSLVIGVVQAATIASVSPQGKVAQVWQMSARCGRQDSAGTAAAEEALKPRFRFNRVRRAAPLRRR